MSGIVSEKGGNAGEKSVMRKRLRRISNVLLLLTALIWGIAFVAQSVAMDRIGPWAFVFWRFSIAGLFLLPVSKISEKPYRSSRADSERSGENGCLLLIGGLSSGIFLGIASVLQQFGIVSTSVGKAGFITALYIIFVPIAGLFLKQRPGKMVWISALIAVCGFYFIAMQTGAGLSIAAGDVLMLLSSFLYTAQILCIDRYSPRVNPVLLSNVQFLGAAAVGGIGMLLFERPDLGALRAAAVPILYAGIFSGAIGYTLQIVGQRYTEPALASLLMSMESIFSALAGWLILGQKMSGRESFGCALVFFAVLLAQHSESVKARHQEIV